MKKNAAIKWSKKATLVGRIYTVDMSEISSIQK